MTEIQEAIKILRGMGWTHAAISRELGVSIGTIDRWWSGSRQPRLAYARMVTARLQQLVSEEAPRKWVRIGRGND